MRDFFLRFSSAFIMGLGLHEGLGLGLAQAQAQAQTQTQAQTQPRQDMPALVNAVPKDASTQSDLSSDARAGKAVAVSREGQCTLCHQIPEHLGAMGDLGPPLGGVASRLSAQAIEVRVKDSRRVNPYTIMPPYFSTDSLSQVDPKFKGQTLLSEAQLRQVLAYLSTLK